MVFSKQNKKQECFVIELKDGDTFDTKKAEGERANLHKFVLQLGVKIPWTVGMRFWCFNQSDKAKIQTGFKNKISEDQAMTGAELCSLLQIDYKAICKERKTFQTENLTYFIDKLLEIAEVYDLVKVLTAKKTRLPLPRDSALSS